jgi:hypothetical protein
MHVRHLGFDLEALGNAVAEGHAPMYVDVLISRTSIRPISMAGITV